MSTASYTVAGMTCGHCAESVSEEIRTIPGVTDVNVDLATGAVSITSEDALTESAVRDAVTEAGYSLAG